MKTYQKGDLYIVWKPEKCIHSGNCVRGLPKVFKPKERPWIIPVGATKEEVVEQVAKCPTGALSMRKIFPD